MSKPAWGVKTLPHIQIDGISQLFHLVCRISRHTFKEKMYCVHCGHLFPVGNKTLHTLKDVYVVGTLKFGATLFQGRDIHHSEGTRYKRIL